MVIRVWCECEVYFLWILMNVEWSCLESNVMNDGVYGKDFLTYSLTHMN